MNPDQRKDFIEDRFKERGKFQHSNGPLPAEVLIMESAKKVWGQVWRNLAKPLLKALPAPSNYDRAGTQKLLLSTFKDKFNTWTKDELVFLVAVMHTEEMENNCKEAVDAGMCGEKMDEPI